MSRASHALALLVLLPAPLLSAVAGQQEPIDPLVRVVDLRLGEQAAVELSDGQTATVKLLEVHEQRGPVRKAVRQALARVEVNGRQAVLPVAQYHLPVTVGGVQMDCAVTAGYLQRSVFGNIWALDGDARLRLWPAGAPWIRPGSFAYPVRSRWFSSDTQMANEPVFVDGPERPAKPSIYYHYGLDIGGAEGLAEVVAATDGMVVSAGGKVLGPGDLPPTVEPRSDVVYVRDRRGWYYRYAHLYSIDPAIQAGSPVEIGQRIGLLGKENSRGAWSHLHFDISARQPSGRYGIVEGYAYLWQAYHAQWQPPLEAVARPHHLTWTGEPVVLDGSRSWSARGPGRIVSYRWTFGDGTTAEGVQVERRYERAGTYSEALKICDDEGHVDYDFAVVQVIDRSRPQELPPTIHAAYWPTFDIKPGDEVTFKVRSFRIAPDEGREVWDFGDGSPPVAVRSDGNVDPPAKDGYAVTTHRYGRPGCYLVSVQRRNARGETATARLQVLVSSL